MKMYLLTNERLLEVKCQPHFLLRQHHQEKFEMYFELSINHLSKCGFQLDFRAATGKCVFLHVPFLSYCHSFHTFFLRSLTHLLYFSEICTVPRNCQVTLANLDVMLIYEIVRDTTPRFKLITIVAGYCSLRGVC